MSSGLHLPQVLEEFSMQSLHGGFGRWGHLEGRVVHREQLWTKGYANKNNGGSAASVLMIYFFFIKSPKFMEG